MKPASPEIRERPSGATLAIGTYEHQTRFRPGERVKGKALWILDQEPERVDIRLFWFTRGKGTEDVQVVNTATFERPGRRGEGEFDFEAPNGPYSFSGRLITLVWALEVVVLPSVQAERVELTISPTGEEIVLAGPTEER